MFDQVLPGYWRSHPEVTLDIDVARTSEIVQRIVDDRAYIGLVFQPPNDARLRAHYARPEPIRAIVRQDHPLARLRRPLLLTDLAEYPGAAMQEGFGVRQHIQAAEISEQVRLRNVLTTSSFKALWQFAAAGIGYALTPPIAVTADMRARRLASLPLANPILNQGSLQVLSRAGRHISRPRANCWSTSCAASARRRRSNKAQAGCLRRVKCVLRGVFGVEREGLRCGRRGGRWVARARYPVFCARILALHPSYEGPVARATHRLAATLPYYHNDLDGPGGCLLRL